MARHKLLKVRNVFGPPDTLLPLWMEKRVNPSSGDVQVGWQASCSCGWKSGVVKRTAIAIQQAKDHYRQAMAQT